MPYIIIVIVVLVVVVAVWAIATYNKLVSSKALVEEAFSGMDVYLKQRYDLVPNLVETVKGYAAHEAETLQKVMESRIKVGAAAPQNVDEAISAEVAFSSSLSRLLAVAENYPELKSNTNFLMLQEKLSELEGSIAQSRKYYNGAVRSYNVNIAKFPTVILAGMFGHKAYPYFEIDDAQRENVEVKF